MIAFIRNVAAVVALGVALSQVSPVAAQAAAPGTVLKAAPLAKNLWVPGAGSAYRLTYTTTDARGRPATSTGEVFVPRGTAPRGGWPVISWAHGTSGLGDGCAPSVMGPALPERDMPYLAAWMKEGYAIVASDYAGLGTPGLPAYLHGRSTAHNIVDMVKAGRRYAAKLPAGQRFSRQWAVVGQSQGAGAAIYTARYATAYGGSELDYKGAVGTGTPAYIDKLVMFAGPGIPPAILGAGITSYLTYIFASLRSVHPELGIDTILTPIGRKYLKLAETACVAALETALEGVAFGAFFTRFAVTLPKFAETAHDYLAMPETGFDKPFFLGHGLLDLSVPYPVTAPYVASLLASRQPLTFKTYLSDHSGTLVQSSADTIPFVNRLFGR